MLTLNPAKNNEWIRGLEQSILNMNKMISFENEVYESSVSEEKSIRLQIVEFKESKEAKIKEREIAIIEIGHILESREDMRSKF